MGQTAFKPSNIDKHAQGHFLCQVCGDESTGFHYGVYACAGCKSFFNRYIQRKLTDQGQCENPRECLITRNNRTKCQFCRLQKCLALGMSSTAVRRGRRPCKNRQSERNFAALPQNVSGLLDMDQQSKLQHLVFSIQKAFKSANTVLDSLTHKFQWEAVKDIKTTSDWEVIYQRYIPSVRQCFDTFATDVPEFLDVSPQEQRLLINQSLLETAIILDSQHVQFDSESLINNKFRFRFEWDEIEELGLLGEVYNEIRRILYKLKKLALTDVELSLLCAMVLFSPDREGVKSRRVLDDLETDLATAFQCQLILNHQNGSLFFLRIVEIMVELRGLSAQFLGHIYDVCVGGSSFSAVLTPSSPSQHTSKGDTCVDEFIERGRMPEVDSSLSGDLVTHSDENYSPPGTSNGIAQPCDILPQDDNVATDSGCSTTTMTPVLCSLLKTSSSKIPNHCSLASRSVSGKTVQGNKRLSSWPAAPGFTASNTVTNSHSMMNSDTSAHNGVSSSHRSSAPTPPLPRINTNHLTRTSFSSPQNRTRKRKSGLQVTNEQAKTLRWMSCETPCDQLAHSASCYTSPQFQTPFVSDVLMSPALHPEITSDASSQTVSFGRLPICQEIRTSVPLCPQPTVFPRHTSTTATAGNQLEVPFRIGNQLGNAARPPRHWLGDCPRNDLNSSGCHRGATMTKKNKNETFVISENYLGTSETSKKQLGNSETSKNTSETLTRPANHFGTIEISNQSGTYMTSENQNTTPMMYTPRDYASTRFEQRTFMTSAHHLLNCAVPSQNLMPYSVTPAHAHTQGRFNSMLISSGQFMEQPRKSLRHNFGIHQVTAGLSQTRCPQTRAPLAISWGARKNSDARAPPSLERYLGGQSANSFHPMTLQAAVPIPVSKLVTSPPPLIMADKNMVTPGSTSDAAVPNLSRPHSNPGVHPELEVFNSNVQSRPPPLMTPRGHLMIVDDGTNTASWSDGNDGFRVRLLH